MYCRDFVAGDVNFSMVFFSFKKYESYGSEFPFGNPELLLLFGNSVIFLFTLVPVFLLLFLNF